MRDRLNRDGFLGLKDVRDDGWMIFCDGAEQKLRDRNSASLLCRIEMLLASEKFPKPRVTLIAEHLASASVDHAGLNFRGEHR